MIDDWSVPERRAGRLRRLAGRLLPALLVASLLLGPLAIWLIKRQDPAIRPMELAGRVVEPRPGEAAGGEVPVELEDGTVLRLPAGGRRPAPGETVIVLRTERPDGTFEYSLARRPGKGDAG